MAGRSQITARSSNSPRVDLNLHSWAWEDIAEEVDSSKGVILIEENRSILFHPTYSSGTIVVRGDTPFVSGQEYYWEIEILTPLYGTDVMIGVGTSTVSLTDNKNIFCSLLGMDKESWGYSYNGSIQHNGRWQTYGPGFNNSSTIGVYLNTWEGTLSYFVDGKPLGIAFHLPKGPELYPMVCSTAACSALRLIYSFSCPSSLQLLSLRSLSTNNHLMSLVSTIPGFQALLKRTSLSYNDSTEEECLDGVGILQEKNNQGRPNFIIINDDNECENALMQLPRKRKKRQYIMDIMAPCGTSSERCINYNETNIGTCAQCGANLRPTVQIIHSRLAMLRSSREQLPSNPLCIICDTIL